MYRRVKRLFDIVVAGAALLALSPVLLVLAVLIARRMGRPVLFVQVRPGKDAKPFRMLKFRTMRDAVDAQGNPLPDADRLTPLGAWLRASSLDELPELWNVLRGDMSLVGPRPLLMEYLPLYSPEQARRHEMRPGITGWAQINGRNAISWDEKFAHDIWYVDNAGFWLDLRILVGTVRKVLARADIDGAGVVGQEKFRGNDAG
jgi:lipopolysaccharide/colanic/teichoic acid biosynthesis glycosyltransferase